MVLLKKANSNFVLLFIFLSMFLFICSSSFSSNETNLTFDIIIPIDPDYDDNTLKKLDDTFMDDIFADTEHTTLKDPSTVLGIMDGDSQKYPESSTEYQTYKEIYDTWSSTSDGIMLIDSEGYYYPTLTLFIGGGDSDDIVTLSLTLTEYYLIESSGTVSQTGEGTPYARIYNAEVPANNYNGKNIKYEISYRSYDTVVDDYGVTHDVHHVVTSAEGYNTWLRFEDVIDTTTTGTNYAAVVNALSRVYHTDAPFYDTSLKRYIWPYYQEIDKISLIPISPEGDSDYFTITNGTSEKINTLSIVNNTSNFNVLIEGEVLEPNAVYFDFINSTLSVESYELDSVQAEVYISDGIADSYAGTAITSASDIDLTGILHHFYFYADYDTLLNEMTANNADSFDVVLTGKSKRIGDDGNQISVTVILDDIKLPRVTLNSIKITNETTKQLWESLGLDSLSYSTVNFTAVNGIVSDIRDNDGNDGNYAKNGDTVSITLDYDAVYDSNKYSFDTGICLLYDSKVTNLTSTGNTYTTTLGDYFSGNGTAYMVLKNANSVADIFGYEKNKTEALYIDNRAVEGELMVLSSGGAIYSKYINGNDSILYSSDEDGLFYPSSGKTGTRAYLNIFDYNSSPELDRLGITNPEPHPSIQNGEHYYRVVDGVSSFSEPLTLNGHYNDGEYIVRKLIAIDKAGNIGTSNKTDISSILSELCSSGLNDTVYQYWVDTVVPDIQTVSLEKVADANGLPLSGEVPFKSEDTLSLCVDFSEENPYSYEVSELTPYLTSSIRSSSPDTSFPKTATITTDSSISISFTVENSNTSDDTGSNHNFGYITVTDKAGNTASADVIGELLNTPPDDVYPETYETLMGWDNNNINGVEDLNIDSTYWFSKGSSVSGAVKPAFILNFTGDMSKVFYADIMVNGTNTFTAYTPSTSMVNIAAVDENIYLNPNSLNTVQITPYSASGKEGDTLSKNIVVDTCINSSSTDKISKTASYMPSTGRYQFELDLSKVSELAGLKGYKVVGIKSKIGSSTISSTPTVYYPTGDSDLGSDYSNHMELFTTSFTSLASANIKKNISIGKDDVVAGSKSTLVVSVIDKLGSQEDLEFNFLIPNPGIKLKAKSSNSNKVIVSNVKIVGETNEDKGFEIESMEETAE